MKKLYELGKKLFPINRSITGKGLRQTLAILKKNTPEIKIRHIISNTKVYDWQVPSEWNVKNAYVLDKFNKKIIDFKKNNLHLVGYSVPIKKYLKKNNLLKHIHTSATQKNAIPYVTSYYKKYWGFCLGQIDKTLIKNRYKKNDKFFVNIDSSFNKKGKLSYGELLIKGDSSKEILISTYICHPSLANNELSGPLVTLKLIKFFLNKKNKKSIRFLFLPETIGSISYINKNLRNIKKNIVGGYVLTCIGDERNYSYLYSKYKNSISDQAAIKAFKNLNVKFKKYDFLSRGSDERQFNSPNIDLGIGSIMRSKYETYPEYHTSLDNFNLVTEKGLLGGYKIAKAAILNLMNVKIINNYNQKIKKSKNPTVNFLCEPNMGKRGLYPTISKKENNNQDTRNLMNFIQYSDGYNSIKEISKLIRLPRQKTKKIYYILKKHKILS